MIASSSDQIIRLWDLRSTVVTQPIATFRGREPGISSFAISPNWRWLATSTFDSPGRIWDLSTSEFDASSPTFRQGDSVVRVLRADRAYTQSAFLSREGRWLVTHNLWSPPSSRNPRNGDARIVDLSASESVALSRTLASPGNVITVVQSTDRRWIAAAGFGGTVHLYDLDSDTPSDARQVLQHDRDTVDSLAFSPDGRWLAAASQASPGGKYAVRLWDLAVEPPSVGPKGMVPDLGSDVCGLEFSPDGRHLAVAGRDQFVHMIGVGEEGLTPKKLLKDPLHEKRHSGTPVVLFLDDRWLLTRVWLKSNVPAVSRLWDLSGDLSAPVRTFGVRDPLGGVISPDRRWLIDRTRLLVHTEPPGTRSGLRVRSRLVWPGRLQP